MLVKIQNLFIKINTRICPLNWVLISEQNIYFSKSLIFGGNQSEGKSCLSYQTYTHPFCSMHFKLSILALGGSSSFEFINYWSNNLVIWWSKFRYNLPIRVLLCRHLLHWMSTNGRDSGCLPLQQYHLYRGVRPYVDKMLPKYELFQIEFDKQPGLFQCNVVEPLRHSLFLHFWSLDTMRLELAARFRQDYKNLGQLSSDWKLCDLGSIDRCDRCTNQ